jgi:hypothetical protein
VITIPKIKKINLLKSDSISISWNANYAKNKYSLKVLSIIYIKEFKRHLDLCHLATIEERN